MRDSREICPIVFEWGPMYGLSVGLWLRGRGFIILSGTRLGAWPGRGRLARGILGLGVELGGPVYYPFQTMYYIQSHEAQMMKISVQTRIKNQKNLQGYIPQQNYPISYLMITNPCPIFPLTSPPPPINRTMRSHKSALKIPLAHISPRSMSFLGVGIPRVDGIYLRFSMHGVHPAVHPAVQVVVAGVDAGGGWSVDGLGQELVVEGDLLGLGGWVLAGELAQIDPPQQLVHPIFHLLLLATFPLLLMVYWAIIPVIRGQIAEILRIIDGGNGGIGVIVGVGGGWLRVQGPVFTVLGFQAGTG